MTKNISAQEKRQYIIYGVAVAAYIVLIIGLITFHFTTKGDFGRCGVLMQQFESISTTRQRTPLGFAPWYAMIRHQQKLEPGCGAAIISEEWVVSINSCLYSGSMCKNATSVTDCAVVVAGAQNLLNQNYGTHHEIVEQYNFTDDSHKDIVLIRVMPPFTYRSPGREKQRGVAQVCLPEDESIPEKTAIVTGYGSEHFWQDMQVAQLKSAKIHVLPDSHCSSATNVFQTNNTENIKYNLCVGSENDDDSSGYTCQKDSGSLLTVLRNDRVVLIGLAKGRGLKAMPSSGCSKQSHYLNIAYFREWIQKKTGI